MPNTNCMHTVLQSKESPSLLYPWRAPQTLSFHFFLIITLIEYQTVMVWYKIMHHNKWCMKVIRIPFFPQETSTDGNRALCTEMRVLGSLCRSPSPVLHVNLLKLLNRTKPGWEETPRRSSTSWEPQHPGGWGSTHQTWEGTINNTSNVELLHQHSIHIVPLLIIAHHLLLLVDYIGKTE